jgi:hypothetical protein
MDGFLTVNPTYKESKRAIVVDNFYKDPWAVRDFALKQEFFDDEGYVGRRTRKQFDLPGVKEAFEELLGQKITGWSETYGMNARFQHNWSGERLVYHCDDQKWAGMIYLTPNAPPSCGTSTWMHRETRVHHNTQVDWTTDVGFKVFPGKTFCDRTPYDEVDRFGNIFNRLVLFDGGCIHSASEYFGSDLEDCRLWHMFFFDTEVI